MSQPDGLDLKCVFYVLLGMRSFNRIYCTFVCYHFLGCEPGRFSCDNGNSTHSDCINPLLVCDKECDCNNTCADEKDCYYSNPTTSTVATTTAPTRPSKQSMALFCTVNVTLNKKDWVVDKLVGYHWGHHWE